MVRTRRPVDTPRRIWYNARMNLMEYEHTKHIQAAGIVARATAPNGTVRRPKSENKARTAPPKRA